MENDLIYKLTDQQQEALYALLLNACREKDITTGFAASRSNLLRNIIDLLGKKAYSHASRKDLLAVAEYLGESTQLEDFLRDAVPLEGTALKLHHQFRKSQ